ncbi:hypothetical protein [Vibrio crassostreae]|uniref:hypothetical protein n=1 Tax=Vibrio crassostreae TaxID=246167 RepID=UPI001B304FD8|nr:hypothetical protein [Vibrio crassostreae]
MYDNKMIKQVCILIAAATAVTSASLTFSFMYNLGTEGFMANVMGAIGLIMDCTKVVAPFLVFYFWRSKRYISSVFSAIITVALCAVSFTASISAIESKVDDVRVVTQQAIESNKQHEILMSQVESYQKLAEEQRSIGHLTKSRETMQDVEETLAKAASLNAELTQTASTKTVIKYGKEITLACALLIECVSILMSLALHNSIQVVPSMEKDAIKGTKHESKVGLEDALQTMESADKPEVITEAGKDTPNESLNIAQSQVSEEETIEQIKAGVLSRNHQPSIRGLAGLKASRETINKALRELLDDGKLEPYRRGYRLVEAES